MEGLELICFQIISSVGTARSIFIEAIHEAKEGNIQAARDMITEGAEVFTQGHHSHMELIQKEASGEKTEINLLLLHTEDMLMSAESFRILAIEFIDLYEILNKKLK
jgi:PTS system cellobiose-specific IIA component